MEKKPYSDHRWWDNPMPISSLCNSCENWLGRVKCKKYEDEVPREILNKSFPRTENFKENYCEYRKEKDTSDKMETKESFRTWAERLLKRDRG